MIYSNVCLDRVLKLIFENKMKIFDIEHRPNGKYNIRGVPRKRKDYEKYVKVYV